MMHVMRKLFFFWPHVGSDCSSGLIRPREAFQSTRHPDSIVFVETLASFVTAETCNENQAGETQFSRLSSLQAQGNKRRSLSQSPEKSR